MTSFLKVFAPYRWSVLALALAGLSCGDDKEVGVERIDPRAGHLQGEQPVRIHGRNFRTDISYTIYFGNRKATSVTIADPQTILVTTPSRSEPGLVDVTIRGDDGTAFRITNGFKYERMGGSVVEKLGTPGGGAKPNDSKLAY